MKKQKVGNQSAKRTSQAHNTPVIEGKNLEASSSEHNRDSSQAGVSSNKLTTKHRDLINTIVANILPDSESKKYTLNIAPEYRLCVTNLEGAKNYHYIRPTPRVINQEFKVVKTPTHGVLKKGTVQYEISIDLDNNKQPNDHLKKILKVQRLKRFTENDLEEIVNITEEAFKFMADPEEYGISQMRDVLLPHMSISQMPIAKTPVGQQLMKDGVILLTLIEILSSYSRDQLKYKEMAFDTMSRFPIETNYQEFWEMAEQFANFTEHMLQKSLKRKLEGDEEQSSSSQSSSSSSSGEQNYDYGGNTLSQNWRPSKRKLSPQPSYKRQQPKSEDKSKKKMTIWMPYSQPAQQKQLQQEPLGSCYTFKAEKVEEEKHGLKILEVRTSARIKSSRQKKIEEVKEKLREKIETKSKPKQVTPGRKSKKRLPPSPTESEIQQEIENLNSLKKKEASQKKQLKEWLKDHLDDVDFQDFIHDRQNLFEALTPEDLELKRIFDQVQAKKNSQSSKKKAATQEHVSQSDGSSRVISTSSSSSSEQPPSQPSEPQSSEHEVQEISESSSESSSRQQTRQDLRRMEEEDQEDDDQEQQYERRKKALHQSAKRNQRNVNNARFINRGFNPESPSKIIYQVDQEYRQSSSRRNQISSIQAQDNNSERGISSNKRFLKRHTQVLPSRIDDSPEEEEREEQTDLGDSKNSRRITQYYQPIRRDQDSIHENRQEDTPEANQQLRSERKSERLLLSPMKQPPESDGKSSTSKNRRMKQISNKKQLQSLAQSFVPRQEASLKKGMEKAQQIFEPLPTVQVISEKSAGKSTPISSSKKNNKEPFSQQFKRPPPEIDEEQEAKSHGKPTQTSVHEGHQNANGWSGRGSTKEDNEQSNDHQQHTFSGQRQIQTFCAESQRIITELDSKSKKSSGKKNPIELSPFTQQSEDAEQGNSRNPEEMHHNQNSPLRQQNQGSAFKRQGGMQEAHTIFAREEETKDNYQHRFYPESQDQQHRFIAEIEFSQQQRKSSVFKQRREYQQQAQSGEPQERVSQRQGRNSSKAPAETYRVVDDEIIITSELEAPRRKSLHEYKVEIPMVPERLICANLNGNNNYALVQLTRASAFDLGTKYAFVPLRMGQRLNRRQVLMDQSEAARLLGTEDIGYIGMTMQLQEFIEREGKIQAAIKSKGKTYSP